MAVPTYEIITDAEIAPNAPVKTSLVRRLRDNALALFGIDADDPSPALFISNAPNRARVYNNPTAVGTFSAVVGRRYVVYVRGGGGGRCRYEIESGDPPVMTIVQHSTGGNGGTFNTSFIATHTSVVVKVGGKGGEVLGEQAGGGSATQVIANNGTLSIVGGGGGGGGAPGGDPNGDSGGDGGMPANGGTAQAGTLGAGTLNGGTGGRSSTSGDAKNGTAGTGSSTVANPTDYHEQYIFQDLVNATSGWNDGQVIIAWYDPA